MNNKLEIREIFEKKSPNNYGFTLLEILMVIAIMGILITIIISSFSILNKSQALEKSVRQGASIVSQARSLTLSSKEDSNYGVHFESSTLTLFKGSTYSALDGSNITTSLNNLVLITNIALTGGGSDVVFERLNGSINTPGTITYTLGSKTKSLTISGTGLIEVGN